MNFSLRFLFLALSIFTGSVSFEAYANNVEPNLNKLEKQTLRKDGEIAEPNTGTITVNNASTCLKGTRPVITFTGKGGTAPYTFVYKINNTADITIVSQTGKDTIMVQAPTDKDGAFKYTLIKVKDATSAFQDVSGDVTVTVNLPPVANFTFQEDNVCSGTNIQFTSTSNGTEPMKYLWDFGDKLISTDKNPTHAFVSLGCDMGKFKIKLTITDANGCISSVEKELNVKQKPDISFSDLKHPFDPFSNCGNASISNPDFSIEVTNTSKSANCINSYSLDWGDGSSIVNNLTFPIPHTYTKLGAFNLVITAKGKNGCDNSITYVVKNVTNPSVGVTSPGTTTNLCSPTNELKFEIAKWGTNSPGTKYDIDYGDGTPVLTLVQEDLINSAYYNSGDPSSSQNFPIPHSYKKSNCPLKEFIVTVIAYNVCSSTTGTVNNITVLTKPQPDFDNSPACVNTNMKFTNTTIGGYNPNCDTFTEYNWDFGDGASSNQGGDVTHTYKSPGQFTVSLSTKNYCGEVKKTKQITINPLPTGNIEGGATVCKDAPTPEITFTGTSGTAPFVFTYKINTGSNQTIKTTTGNSIKLKIQTNNPGKYTYTLISVTDANGCSQNQSGEAVIEVKSAPTATISGTQNVCQSDPYPNITLSGSGGTTPYTFTYNINGGENKTVSTTSGNSITIQAPTENVGVFKYNLLGVTDASVNACTTPQTGTATVTVNQPPAEMSLNNHEFCNGVATQVISFSNSVVGTTYSWTNSNTSIGLVAGGTGNISSFIAKNSSSGPITSTITVTPKANGCNGKSQTFTITVNPSATVLFTPNNQNICSGENSTEVQLSSATTGATFSWTAVQPAGITGVTTSGTNSIPVQTLINTTNAPIDVIYKAKAIVSGSTSCEGADYNYVITINPRPVIKENFKPEICSNSFFSISPENNANNTIQTGTKYTWTEPLITPEGSITGANAQNIPQNTISQTLVNTTSSIATVKYTVTPEMDGCKGNPFDIEVSVAPMPIANTINNITVCSGSKVEEINLTGSPGTTVLNWTSDNSSVGIGASGIDKIPSFTAINTSTSPIKTVVTVIPAYKNGAFVCEGTPIHFSITVNPSGQVNNPSIQNTCNGVVAAINFTTINSGGLTNYHWTSSNSDIGLASTGSGNILFTPINTGISVLTTEITVIPTFTTNGVECSGAPEKFTINVNPTATVNQPDNQTLCSGIETNEVIFSGNIPGEIFKWTVNNSSIGLPASGEGNIPAFFAKNNSANPIVATITVTPTLNGCDGLSKTFTITVNPSGILTKQPVSSTICLGDIPTQLSVAYINGTGLPTYQWYKNKINDINGGKPVTNATSAILNPTYIVADTSFYYCIITFPSGSCNTLISDLAKVTINPFPVISTINQEIGSGETFTVIPSSVNGDVVPAGTTYIWSDPVIDPPGSVSGASSQSTPQTSISQTLTNPTMAFATVTYTVTPTSGICPGAKFNIVVQVSPPLNPNATVNPVLCFGANNGSISTKIEGGSPFSTGNPYKTLWTGPNGFTSNSANISNLQPGTYNLEVTDAIDMKFRFKYDITEPDELIAVSNKVQDISCFGAANGEIELTTSGGTKSYKFSWTKDKVFYADTEDISGLAPGLYEVSVTDANNCGPKILSFNITEPKALTIDLISQTDVKCFGDSTGAVKINVLGGTLIEIEPGVFDYMYKWTGPLGFISTEKDLDNIPAGTYNLNVTDKQGCSLPFSITINQTEEIKVSTKQKTISCFGQNDASIEVIISGGIAPYETHWDNFATGTFQKNLSAGDYKITVTDALGCQKTIVETVVEAGIFSISPVVKHVTCAGANNGSIQLNFVGGLDPISFEWKDDTLAGDTRNNLRPGKYTFNISEGGGCSIADSFVIIQPMPLIITPSITSVFDCNIQNGGAINLSVIGGIPPYKYSWSNGEKTKDLTKIPAGDYLVTVTDSVGCLITEKFTVNRPPSISVDVIPKIEYCNTDSIKAIYTAVVSGGVPPFKYEWSMGKTRGLNNEKMESDQTGTAFVKVTDASNCSAIETFVASIPKLGISDSLKNCNQHNYQFDALAANINSEVYSYFWDFGDGTSSNLKNPEHIFAKDGVYKVLLTITNLTNTCVSEYIQYVDVEPRPTIKIEGKQKFCEGEAITLKATGADTYSWAHGPKTDTTLITREGVYAVTGTTKAGCNNADSYAVSYFAPFNYKIESENDKFTVTNKENEIKLSTLYTPDTYYIWDFGDSTQILEGINLSNPPTHFYMINGDGHFDVNLFVTNPNTCIEKDSVKIGINLTTVPNTFTPNNDGHNDLYMEGWNLKIFNRNGVLMFEGNEGWDGNYKGKPVANDTYFVIIYDSSEMGGSSYRRNYVTVIR